MAPTRAVESLDDAEREVAAPDLAGKVVEIGHTASAARGAAAASHGPEVLVHGGGVVETDLLAGGDGVDGDQAAATCTSTERPVTG